MEVRSVTSISLSRELTPQEATRLILIELREYSDVIDYGDTKALAISTELLKEFQEAVENITNKIK